MGVDGFTRSFESQAFRRFMLTVAPATLQEAVGHAENYYAVTSRNFDRATAKTLVDQDDEEEETVTTVKTDLKSRRLEKLEKAIEGQASMMSQLLQLLTTQQQRDNREQQATPPRQVSSQPAPPTVQQKARRQIACFQCGGPHLRRQCPQILNMQSGNDQGPTMA
jgi:(p)ppGpp synthase/HD superfamily hydrolase